MAFRELFAAWLPEYCPGCAGPTAGGFCDGCRGDFAAAAPASGPVRVLAPFRYEPPLDSYIHALKYHGARRLGRALGLLLLTAALERGAEADALIPVPLHPRRMRERGYNQAVEIARPLARALGVPLVLRGVARRRVTAAQIGLGAEARASNLRDAFRVTRRLSGLRVAIVDDVVTTGATVAALAAPLAAAGARSVEAWAVAHTPPRAT